MLRSVIFVWSPWELGITAHFAKNWPQRGSTFSPELLSQRTRYCGAAESSHRMATATQIGRDNRPRMPIFPHMPDSRRSDVQTGFTVRPQTSVTSCSSGLMSSAEGSGQRRDGKEMCEPVNMQGSRRTALWERHESWTPGSSASRGELPDAFGVRAARFVESTHASGNQARVGTPGVGHRGNAQATRRECRYRESVIHQHGKPERNRRSDGCSAAATGRTGRRGITRKAGATSNGGRPSTRQDMAISKGRMHFEPFTVSGCPDQEIRNADL